MSRIVVTGATGYVGGRLVPALLAAGHRVTCVARDPDRLRDRPWRGDVTVVRGDVADRTAMDRALDGAEAAYYLVHALAGGPGFEVRDRRAAEVFAGAASGAGVGRLVYLGGLAPPADALSAHLGSRAEVGDILASSGVPTAVLRAGIVIGSGSASFEMLRYLTERLPVMVTPRWVTTRTQPIAVRDVIRYLVGAVDLPPEVDRAFDLGGPDVVTFADMMRRYAAAAGLPRRWIVPVPLLTPRLSSRWVDVVTPVPGSIARPLVESLRNESVCSEHDIARWIPDPPGGLVPFDDAVRLALARVQAGEVATRWADASLPGPPSDPLPGDPAWSGGSVEVDERSTVVDAPPDALWSVIEGIGGAHGWYSWGLAWRVRGLADRMIGGVGLRRGRRHPDRLQVGDALDFWRVEAIDRGRLLRLRAEMRLPGEAWLELAVEPEDGGRRCRYRQRAVFRPRGLGGTLYWHGIAPFHGIVFGGMTRNIRAAAERRAVAGASDGPAPAGGRT